MKKIFSILPILSVLLLASCTNKELQDEFTNTDNEIGLTCRGESLFEYNEAECQLGYKESSHEFRVSDDTMTDYFILRLDAIPSVGSETTGTLIYTTEDNVVTKSAMKFKLVKTGSGDMYWFWNKKNAIGAVVRKF